MPLCLPRCASPSACCSRQRVISQASSLKTTLVCSQMSSAVVLDSGEKNNASTRVRHCSTYTVHVIQLQLDANLLLQAEVVFNMYCLLSCTTVCKAPSKMSRHHSKFRTSVLSSPSRKESLIMQARQHSLVCAKSKQDAVLLCT